MQPAGRDRFESLVESWQPTSPAVCACSWHETRLQVLDDAFFVSV
jgi:hypothetical protein